MKAMLFNRLKLVTVLALAFVVTCTGAGVLLSRAPAADQAAPGGKPRKESVSKAATPANTIQVKNFAVEAVDAAAGTLTVADRSQPRWVQSVLQLSNKPMQIPVQIHLLTADPDKPGKGKLSELKVQVQEPLRCEYLSVRLADETSHPAKLQNLPVAKDVAVTIDGRPGKLTDLKPGMTVDLSLAAEDGRLVIKAVQARQDSGKK